MPDGTITSHIDAHVATVLISRPSRRNALTTELCDSLTDALSGLAADTDVRVVLLTGEPPAFCAGADFGGFEGGPDRGGFVPAFHRLLDTIAHLRVPVIAYVNGPALGAGGQIVSQCDLRLAAESAVVGVTAARIGLQLDMPNLTRMVCELGAGAARRILLTGDPLTSEEALRLGVFHRVEPDDVAESEAHKWADTVASRAPLAVQGHKAAIQSIVDSWWLPDGDPRYVDSVEAALKALASDDLREGLQAFSERRPPRFQGR